MDFAESQRELVMVSNRLPVDRVEAADGSVEWRTSPGGLVTAVEPIVQKLGCLWVGWPGDADAQIDPFEIGAMRLVPVSLTAIEVEEYYEGFSNGTLWPLYHDVIAAPVYHREWWEAYHRVNKRFAEAVAEAASPGAIVWVHDYQLQLVPQMLRELRPDVSIGFFLHIPFPGKRMFSQLPWRVEIVEGMLGADVVGFQTAQDAGSFRSVAESLVHVGSHGNLILVPEEEDVPAHQVLAQEFPISIDTGDFEQIASRPEIQRRALEVREELGDPKKLLLGVDRLDYTKGIRHRLKAYGELLAEGEVDAENTVLVQVATPSRENVRAYQKLRDEVELTVGRINGDYGSISHSPVVYLHQGFSREEMVALYLAADVMVITSLRDGMNLVAKEYVACRLDDTGVLVLSEFAGARYELKDALLVNPHNIEATKAALLRALHMPVPEQKRRMRALREVVRENDVTNWSANFLNSLSAIADQHGAHGDSGEGEGEPLPTTVYIPSEVETQIRRLATAPSLVVATDFDGTISPFVAKPAQARMLKRARQALDVLADAPGVTVALFSGRSMNSLKQVGAFSDQWVVSGSHGAEFSAAGTDDAEVDLLAGSLTAAESAKLHRLERRLQRVFGREPGVRLEYKPFGVVVHTRQVTDPERAEELLDAAAALAGELGVELRRGKQVREFTVRPSSKAQALNRLRESLPDSPVVYFGDDVTDEDVFEVLGPNDVGIKVGEGATAADERISDPQTAAAVLALLAELRTGIVIGSDPDHQ